MKTVIGLDLKGQDAGALELAAWLQARTRAWNDIRAVHIARPSAVVGCGSIERTRHDARRFIAKGSAVVAGIDVLERRSIGQGLCEQAGVVDALLIGRGGRPDREGGPVLGQVTRRLLRKLPTATVVVPSDLRSRNIPAGPILVATDARPESDGAAVFGRILESACDRQLVLALVVRDISPQTLQWLPSALGPRLHQERLESGLLAVRAWARRHRLEGVQARVGAGEVVSALLAIGDEIDAVVTVCGSRRLCAVERFFATSVGSSMASRSSRPVAVVPASWRPLEPTGRR